MDSTAFICTTLLLCVIANYFPSALIAGHFDGGVCLNVGFVDGLNIRSLVAK
jgi:hypothetical protein